jgi:predicted transcriptional regulator
VVDTLNRTITTYIHGQFVEVEENATVTDAVNLLHPKKAETAIVTTKEGKPIGIVTDADRRPIGRIVIFFSQGPNIPSFYEITCRM